MKRFPVLGTLSLGDTFLVLETLSLSENFLVFESLTKKILCTGDFEFERLY